MESLEVEIITFVSPHLFYVTTDVDAKHRANFLQNVSNRIKNGHLRAVENSFSYDEIVAVHYGTTLVRARVLEKTSNEEKSKDVYYCWLVDYAVLITTDKIYKLSKQIQKITPRCRQASLNNICYLKEHLELGVTGVIQTVPSIVPSSGVVQYCLELIANSDKITFEVAERFNNILIGEVIIHRNGLDLYLTKELCNKKLLGINDLMFQNLKYSTKEYIKTHLKSIYQVCKSKHGPSGNTSSSDERLSSPYMIENFVNSHMEELDISDSPRLENGRRRKGPLNQAAIHNNESNLKLTMVNEENQNLENLSSCKEEIISSPKPQSASEVDAADQKIEPPPEVQTEGTATLSKSARLLEKIKARKSAEATKQEPERKPISSPDDVWKKVAEFTRRKQRAANMSNRSEQDINSGTYDSSSTTEEIPTVESSDKNEVSEELISSQVSENGVSEEQTSSQVSAVTGSEGTVSPFASLTSKRTSKPKAVFLPAGMERASRKKASPVQVTPPNNLSKYTKSETIQSHTPKSRPKIIADEDCPTIKIPKASGNATDDQLSAEEVEKNSESPEESTSTQFKDEILTKQDFCKLVAGCTCIKCRIALEDDDWDAPLLFEHPTEVTKQKPEQKDLIIKPPPLLKSGNETDELVQKNEILSIDYSGMSAMEKKLSCKLLVHGESIPIPIRHVAQVNIHRDIYSNISKINYKESKRIQHYAFPAITRNQHVFMVNDPKTGKTMGYLPILISFIMEKEERYSQLFKMGGGPIVVILCSNSKKCEEIHDLTKLILDKQNRKISLVTYPGFGNMSNVDILITMPTVLSTLISTRATNFKRLCHLVLEDADVILKSHNDLVMKYLNYADQVLKHRNCPKSVQVIMCAQHWTPQLEDVLTKLNEIPIICIGNYLEAALFGKMKFTMKFLDTGCKEQTLQKLLLDKYKFTKSVIICNPDEIEDAQTFLILKGIDFTSFADVAQEEDILYLEAVWNNAIPGRYSVLLCTDDIYNTLNITSAHMLIHFSLPETWTQFIKRFSCLLENIPTPLNLNQKKIEISSFVFIDENCESRISKFCNFIKIAGLEKELPDQIRTFFEGIKLQEENNRTKRRTGLCQTLKLFGRCDSLHCKKRHMLDEQIDSSEVLPRNGSIKFKILKLTDAGSCSIRLIEHFDLNGKSVRKFEDLTDEITNVLAKKQNYHQIIKPVVTHLYLHKDKEQYFRCILLEMDEFALVYLIDRGIYCKSNVNRLYQMPEELKTIPPQSYEIHFANLIPPYEDSRFSRLASRKAQFLVDSNCPDSVMTGTILLQLGNNLWVDDVYEYREMFDKTLPSIGFQLTRELVNQELAVRSNKPLKKLYNLCQKANIQLPEYSIAKPTVKKVVVEQVEPNWAFLDMDDVHEVTFTFATGPHEFNVRQNKFSKQLLQLEEDIQKAIRKPFYPLPRKIEIGKCYLVKDQVNGNYARGIILNILEEEAEILCVDYGDVVLDNVSNLKHITNELILKLPFQSIQCSMYGIKPIDHVWSDEATDLLYKMAYEEDESTLRSLFISIKSRQDNSIVKRQNSYSVILKDGLTRRVLINELLVDCGFAIPTGDEIQDFDLPELKIESDDECIEEVKLSDDNDDEDEGNDGDIDNAFDFEIFDYEEFVTELQNFRAKKITDSKAIEDKKPVAGNELPAIKAVPSVDYLTPEVYWSETNSHVKLNIKVSDVVSAKMVVKHNRNFHFTTLKEEKKYLLNLLLFAKVENTFQHTILGSQIRVTLKKCKEEEWPRLLYTTEKVRKIYYDLSAMKVMDEEEKVRRPLQLDISDSSSEEEDGRPYFVCSDLDSDYDYDIPNDEV